MNQYNLNQQSFNIIYKELMRVLDGVDKSEAKSTLNDLPNTFTIEDLRIMLSKNYILYEGFGDHIQNLLKKHLIEEDSVNLFPKLTRASEALEDEGIEKKRKKKKTEKTGAGREDLSPKMIGFKHIGKDFANFQKSLQKKLSNFHNIDTVHINAEYQVDIFADSISDELHKSVEGIKDTLQSGFPGLSIKLNIRSDKRTS